MKSCRARSRLHFVGAVLFLLACGALPVHGAEIELGASGGGGLLLGYGSFLDSKAATLAELGAASLTNGGSSRAQLLPGWTVGAYAQMDLMSWLAIRLEVSFQSAGAARLALTSAGAPFDQYDVYFPSVTVPVLLRAGFALGPGRLFASVGPFLGMAAGNITIMDRYSSATTTAVIAPDFAHLVYIGLDGGAGYSIPFGPGVVGVELRSEWSALAVHVSSGLQGGDIYPISLNLVVSYGFRMGSSAR